MAARYKQTLLLFVLMGSLLFLVSQLHDLYSNRAAIYGYTQEDTYQEVEEAEPRVLILGNSLTFSHDLPGMTEAIVRELHPQWREARIFAIAPPGHQLAGHLDDLSRWSPYPRAIEHALGTQEPHLTWHTVLLQDASWIMASPNEADRLASHASIQALSQVVFEHDAKLMLFSSWGYSPAHTTSFTPSQSTQMARDIERGYREAGAQIDATQAGTREATRHLLAGRAFDVLLQEDSALHAKLFIDDRHPSAAGTYLTALVLAHMLTERSVSEVTWRPSSISEQGATRLRQIADAIATEELRREATAQARIQE